MKLTINGNLNPYYAQTLCLLFFPGAKFSQSEEVTAETPRVHVDVVESAESVAATVQIAVGDQSAVGTHTYSLRRRGDTGVEQITKLAAGKAMIAAGKQMFGAVPPWGLMTGVRPAKIAAALFEKGLTSEGVRTALRREFFLNPKKAALLTTVAENEHKIITAMQPNSCSVYISIPFCPSRCAYCSFVSTSTKRLLSLIPDYLVRLCEEITEIFTTIGALGLTVSTVYIGGGTPTILSADQLRLLLSKIAELTDVSALEEYTLESGRPDTITAEKFAVAKEYGVSRVCVNPQSLCDEVLRSIGRSHTSEDFLRAFDVARESGIHCINTDLIVGLPGDNFKTFSKTFDKILSLRPENITVHTFCIKKAADILHSGSQVYSLRGGDAGKCVDYSQLKTQESGYLPYYMYRQKNTVGNFENVGFALEGYEGLYNVYMMEEIHSIFAVGAGAVSKMVDYHPAGGGKPIIERLFYPKYPYEYLRDESTDAKVAAMEAFYQKRGLLEQD